MYLKEIKTSGFKSFADKINLTLDEDITCIVGPNGSGKSNIVDAVKWVLGEQSVKTLRGDSNMTDVIFSGSKSRRPLNLASVSLVFDNTDKALNVPFTEVSVTRKVYRSGENEYYINNDKCRLKDINDLFLDSGIGKYAFNIISQGEVTEIINSSSFERRSIIEEAAGVLKYKKRKEEALRKLNRTNENLVRVKDIKSEIDLRLDPLRKERDNALKYKEYKGKLKNIEVSLIAEDLERLELEYNSNQKTMEDIKEKIATMLKESSLYDTKQELLKKEISSLNEKISSDNGRFLELTRDIEKVNGEINVLKEKGKYEADDKTLYENITKLSLDKKECELKISSSKEDLNVIKNKALDIKNKISNLKEKIDTLSIKLNGKSNLIYQKEKELNDTNYSIRYLENYIEQGSYMNPNAKKVITSRVLSGIHDTIGNLVDTENSYSLALTVALGGSRDFVVVDTPDDAKSAINYLKDNNLGRVTFFPITVIKERYVESNLLEVLKNENGFIGVLSSLVTYNSKYEKIIKNLLGNVLLVDNLDTGNRIKNITNSKYKIVTLTGEVINIGGSITGGKVKTSSVTMEKYKLKQKEEEKKSLTSQINALKEEETKLKEEEKSLNGELLNYEKSLIISDEALSVKESSIDNLQKSLKEISFELDNLNSISSDTISEKQKELIDKIYKMEEEKEKIEKYSKLDIANKNELETTLEQYNADYKLSNSSLRDLEKSLKDYEIANSKNSIKMDNLLEILSENYEMTFEYAKKNYILEIDEAIARENVKEYKRVLQEIGPVNLNAIEEFERVNTRALFLEKQTTDLEEATKVLLKIIDELDEVMKDEFLSTFNKVKVEFDKVFKELFNGGKTSLELTDPDNLLTTGIEINVTPPGKKLRSISLLSGGEKTLTAISLLFAILNIKKIPFCLFDEIEAALDEANVDKVGSYFKKYSGKTQLIIITHKKKTMEYANNLYGITMQESGVSKLVSVKLV